LRRTLFDRLIAADTALDPTLVLFAARPGALGDDVGDTSMDDPERTPILPVLPVRVREELTGRWAERRRTAVGLSPMDALLAATSRAAARLDRGEEFGTIAPGLSADLVLLGADPLADIRNVRRIERVITRGRVYEPKTILDAGRSPRDLPACG
jgi:hypothetical protein